MGVRPVFVAASKPIARLMSTLGPWALFLYWPLAVADLATFSHGDAFEVDISAATVVTLYLLPEVNIALKPKL